jgi:hypothetical protein
VKKAWLRRHALMTCAALIGLTLVGSRAAAIAAAAIAGAAFLWASFLNIEYARALHGRGRSVERAAGDRTARNAVLIACLPPLFYGLLAARVEALRPGAGVLADGPRALVAAVFAFALTFVFVSTLTDWYYVRPRRDGVVQNPPCRREEREPWVDITRWWIVHRTYAATVFYVALWLAIGLVWFEAGRKWESSDWVLFLLVLGSPPLIAAVAMHQWVRELPAAWSLAHGNLPLVLGDWVEYYSGQQKVSGFLYDVSVDEGYRVVDRNLDTSYLPLSRSKAVTGSRPPSRACEHRCEMVERMCEFRKDRPCPSGRSVIV